MDKAQEWLNKEYPVNGTCQRRSDWKNKNKTRAEITELDISKKKLQGFLDLSEFVNLEELDCYDNQLTDLKLGNCLKLKRIRCSNNKLTNLNLSNCSQLKELYCVSNDLKSLKLPCQAKQGIRLDIFLETGVNDFLKQNLPEIQSDSLNKVGNLNIRDSDDEIDQGDELQALGKENIELSFKILRDLQNKLQESKSFSQVEKLINHFIALEKKENKKVKLLKKVFSRKSQAFEKIEKKLGRVNKQIKKLVEVVEESNKELEKWCKGNEEIVDEYKKELDNKKQVFIKKLRESDDPLGLVWNEQIEGVSLDKNLKRLLQAQKEMIRLDDGYYAREAKEELLAELENENFSGELEDVCDKYKEIVQLEEQLDGVKNILRIIDLNLKKKQLEERKGMQIAPTIPLELLTEMTNIQERMRHDIKENHDFDKKEVNYKIIHPGSINSPKFLKEENLSELPTRLYDTKKGIKKKSEMEIEKLRKDLKDGTDPSIKSYAILSYVWGKTDDKSKLTSSGRKSLTKALRACEQLGINYLWMDQICVDQSGKKEKDGKSDKDKEVPKMGKYYSNATVTLIAIQNETGLEENCFDLPDLAKKIVNSEWFSRSWTYQEGWLSKQTIFMFDDKLIDGRAVASFWVIFQPSYTENASFTDITKFEKGTQKIATPLGRVYCIGEHSSEDKLELSLHEALRAVKERKRSIAIDSIYSILGLLPYGEKVKVKYKKRICNQCGGEEKNNCQHEEKSKKWPTYTEKDIRETLCNVMREATKEGCGEILGWHGSGENLLPDIVMEETEKIGKGSIEIVGGLNIRLEKGNDFDESNSIKINVYEYVIDDEVRDITKIERGSLIDGGVYMGKIRIDGGGGEKLSLLGTKKVLKKVEKGDLLVVPNRREWKSDKPFAILVTKKDGYKRIGLVQLYEDEVKSFSQVQEKKISIDLGTNKNINQQPQILQPTNKPYGIPSSSKK